MNTVKLIMCLHSHQPVGNFDSVFEDVFTQSYLPFLNVFYQYPDFKLALHYSGPLLEWIEVNRPEYFDLLREMIRRGQVEMVGGAFYEPILTLLPSRDRLDQIQTMKEYIGRHFKTDATGFWLAERVWEQSLVYDLAEAHAGFTMVDHTHFNYGGFKGIPSGFYRSEDRGKVIHLFPINEKLRYLIPFSEPEDTLEYLKKFRKLPAEKSILVYGDDGEKFGSWPGTFDLMYREKWLIRFIEAVLDNNSWLETSSFSDVLSDYSDSGLAYLPDASYREMMEWALYPEQQKELEAFYKSIEKKPELGSFVRGGSYRNFRKKYHESYIMYARMLEASSKADCDKSRHYLHKAQCNCAYWHGVFGGIYMPHLRNAVFENIIKCEALIKEKSRRLIFKDVDMDGVEEAVITLCNQKLIIDADCGGRLISWDLTDVPTNFQSTFTRQKEYYHRYVLEGSSSGEMAGVHDVPVLKEHNLQDYLVYDSYGRYSMIEHLLDKLPSAEDIHNLNYTADIPLIKRNCHMHKDENKLVLNSDLAGITKTLIFSEKAFKVSYSWDGSSDHEYLAVEWNLFTMSPDAPDKWLAVDGKFIGNTGVFAESKGKLLEFTDEYRGFRIRFESNQDTEIRISPVFTVNLSESGIEKVFQNTTVFFIVKKPVTDLFELTVSVDTI